MAGGEKKIRRLFESAGIRVNGDRPWDIRVSHGSLYNRILLHGSLGLGEAYQDGWWEAESLDQFFDHVLRADLGSRIRITPRLVLQFLGASLSNLQNTRRALHNVSHHYDIGNDLYRAMLDKRLVYSCAYWDGTQNLDEAQEAKLDLICRKMNLQPGQRVLDIGCGWGSFAKFAAERYGVHVVGITLSKEQLELGRQLCQGLPVELRLQDYRHVTETFDHVVSIGMIEHVGDKNYGTFMKTVQRVLAGDGIFLLHTIGGNVSTHSIDPWINRYIFPNAVLPSARQLARAVEGRFVMEDWHNIGVNYDKTLMAWFENFDRHWPELRHRYSDDFYRMWKYYLLSCAATFRSRKNQVWQIVMSRNGIRGGYRPVR